MSENLSFKSLGRCEYGETLHMMKTHISNEDFKNEKGNLVLVYNTKKYGIPCERRFEVNAKLIVIGFVSNGCF